MKPNLFKTLNRISILMMYFVTKFILYTDLKKFTRTWKSSVESIFNYLTYECNWSVSDSLVTHPLTCPRPASTLLFYY